MWTYHVHQKVVCIDDTELGTDSKGIIVAGETYEVRWIGDFDHWLTGYAFCLRVTGVVRPTLKGTHADQSDMPFRASRFKPIITKKTDISVFTAMLNTKQLEPV